MSSPKPSPLTRVSFVITGDLKSKIDRVWDSFWSGGISNPLEVIEHAWGTKIVEYVGRSDDVTLDLARRLDKLHRAGHDVEQILDRAVARKPLPDDRPTAALAYRIREHVRPKRPTAPPPIQQHSPGLGL